jgi:tRNA threonylcarbamoyladenosine biosynthesis protein TsaB
MFLAIDTSSRSAGIALHNGEEILAELTWRADLNHTTALLPNIQHLMQLANVGPQQLTALAVAVGPGSFNGVRIGISTAKGLAFSRQLPLYGISTLDVVAALQPFFAGALAAVIAAGRGRICLGMYAWLDGAWRPSAPAQIVAWQAALAQTNQPTLFAGEIDPPARTLIEEAGQQVLSVPFNVRRPAALAEIAWRQKRAGQSGDLFHITPIYLHQPDAPQP